MGPMTLRLRVHIEKVFGMPTRYLVQFACIDELLSGVFAGGVLEPIPRALAIDLRGQRGLRNKALHGIDDAGRGKIVVRNNGDG